MPLRMIGGVSEIPLVMANISYLSENEVSVEAAAVAETSYFDSGFLCLFFNPKL